MPRFLDMLRIVLIGLVGGLLGGAGPVMGATLVPLNATVRYLKGTAEASSPDATAWRQRGFSDAAWLSAPLPLWYGDAQPSPGTQLTDMQGGYTCVFIRQRFNLSTVNDIATLELGAQSDDGFIAWINGVEVGRFNMPDGAIPFNGLSLAALSEPIPFQTIVLQNPRAYLVAGENVLAIQAFNTSLSGSSDFVINVSLSSTVDTAPPVVESLIPQAGSVVSSLTSIEVAFSEEVTGVDAADLRVNGVPASSVEVFNARQYVFDFPQPATGVVQVSWAANAGIADLAGVPNAFGGGSWSYTLDPNAPPPGVLISEFMADNDRTINDEDGDASDWIELRNAGTTTANLAGWFLSDDPLEPTKWRVPNVSLAAEGYLLIFASGKNRTNPVARLHTNFRLDAAGSYLGLFDTATNVVSEFSPLYPPQTGDVSYGYAAPGVKGFFPVPTPGAANAAGGPGFAVPVVFSRGGGTFTTAFPLALSAAAPGAEIRYTLDGSVPSAASPLYTGPLNVTTTVQVRARAYQPGLLPGPVRSESFVLLAASVVNFTSDLPLMIIHNFGAGSVPANGDQFAYVAIFEKNTAGRSSLTNTPTLSARSGINIRGSSTQGYPKSSFSVEWWDESNSDLELSPLGLPEDSDWVLYAPNNFEPILTHNPFMHELSRQVGRYSPRTRFVEVYLNTSGGAVTSSHYNGIYVLEEKISRGKDRVDVDKLEPEHLAQPEVSGGYLLKVDRLDPGDSGLGAAGQTMAYVDPKETEIELPQRDPQEQYIRNYMNAFGTALNGANYQNPTTGFRAYVDVDSWIDHHILNVMSFNVDALRLSAYFYKEREGKLFFGPLWDFDRALGSTDGRDANPRVWRSQVSDRGTDFFNYTWWGRMFTDPDFWQRWIDRWQELRLGPLSWTNLSRWIDQLSNEVREAQPRELSRWGVQPRGGSYQGEINYTKAWLSNRVNFIDTNFLAKPVFSHPGGNISAGLTLTLSGPAGATLYYTLDGTDPRLSGGAVAAAARVYSGPIQLNANARVVARSRNTSHSNLTGPDNPPLSSPWSGVTAATFVVATPPLVITEIMYHPAPPPPGNTNDADLFEFIELKNRGAATLSLAGFRFTNGIDFVFGPTSGVTSLAPGDRVLLVRNRNAFLSRYPGTANIAGEFTGNLDNSGESLGFVGPYLEPIHDFRFENSWYPITDGLGFSLVLVDENAPLNTWSNQFSWRPSGREGGSPGASDPTAPVVPGVRVNEALTHTDPPQVDTIELFNPTGSSVDVGGWFLSDDFNQPKKYRIPAGTSVAAGGYLQFTEAMFNSGANGFLLSSTGDEVYLFSGDASTNLTGYYHGFQFGAAPNGVSFGRYVNSVGTEFFVAQSANTLGGVNAAPRVGPVVVNEILYNPPLSGTNVNTVDEYIELANITSQPVALFDPNAATNTWRLAGGVDFRFPTNTTLAANGLALVVAFDPVADPAQLGAFRSKYGVASSVPVFGPWTGSLENQGERVRLYRPDIPNPTASPGVFFVPQILVDQVTYLPAAPWPTNASATGNSLQRITAGAFGDDPANWRGAAPSAGSVNPGGGTVDTDGDGMPDDWETANGLDPRSAAGADGAGGDPDGDGRTNLEEYISGTDPQSASSYLRVESVELTGGGVRLTFNGVAGKSYTVLWRAAVANGAWQRLTDVDTRASDGPVQVTDSGVGSVAERYYRLVTPRQP